MTAARPVHGPRPIGYDEAPEAGPLFAGTYRVKFAHPAPFRDASGARLMHVEWTPDGVCIASYGRLARVDELASAPFPERRRAAAAMRSAGYTRTGIANVFGISPRHARALLAGHDVRISPANT